MEAEEEERNHEEKKLRTPEKEEEIISKCVNDSFNPYSLTIIYPPTTHTHTCLYTLKKKRNYPRKKKEEATRRMKENLC